MAASTYHYLFGPVASRRLGQSLGVDIVPMKTCTQNCLYCQLGKDAPLTLERKPYVPTEAVLDELRRRVTAGLTADYITFSGSGEPTLHSELGRLLDGVKAMTDIPTAVITNGTLLQQPDVRRDCAKADVVLPSLDAGDAETFEALNHPHPDLHFDRFIDGLVQFRAAYDGQIWLEVFFCLGVNTDDAQIAGIARRIAQIRPDKIQINTAVRPTTHTAALPVPPGQLADIARKLHPAAEIIAEFGPDAHTTDTYTQADAEAVVSMLRRHPCSLEDVCKGLSCDIALVRPLVQSLVERGEITAIVAGETTLYRSAHAS